MFLSPHPSLTPQIDLAVYPDIQQTAAQAAERLAKECIARLRSQPRVCVALSGGRTPWLMLDALVDKAVDWSRIDVIQVDERIVSKDDDRLNAGKILKHWVKKTPEVSFYPMPVEMPVAEAIDAYTELLKRVCPEGIDIVCLGLGADAHTASLIPQDPLVNNTTDWVGCSVIYQETRRLSLLQKPLNAAKLKLWLVAGADKQLALGQLMRHDRSVPAGLITGPAVVFADQDAETRS